MINHLYIEIFLKEVKLEINLRGVNNEKNINKISNWYFSANVYCNNDKYLYMSKEHFP
jgi:hypothetical protein